MQFKLDFQENNVVQLDLCNSYWKKVLLSKNFPIFFFYFSYLTKESSLMECARKFSLKLEMSGKYDENFLLN